MHTKLTLLATLFATVLTSCSSDIDVDNDDVVTSGKMPVKIATRATSSSFNVGDEMGLYMVNYVNGVSQPIKPSGNYVDNKKFTFIGTSWAASGPIYWSDDQTHADFYAYYPYDGNIVDANAYSFMVNVDQTTETAYAMSDFMWCKVTDLAPTTAQIQLKLNHRMSKVLIKVEAGDGFTQEDLLAGTMSLSINGVKIHATIDLSTGIPTATGVSSTITPFKTGDLTYEAIVIPQTVANGNLLSLKLDNTVYHLQKGVAFEMGKQYTFTVTLSKKTGGMGAVIVDWEYETIHGSVG